MDEVRLEAAAAVEHEQWMQWAQQIMDTEPISEERRKRWAKYMVPYGELADDVKEHDRVWARKGVSAWLEAGPPVYDADFSKHWIMFELVSDG